MQDLSWCFYLFDFREVSHISIVLVMGNAGKPKLDILRICVWTINSIAGFYPNFQTEIGIDDFSDCRRTQTEAFPVDNSWFPTVGWPHPVTAFVPHGGAEVRHAALSPGDASHEKKAIHAGSFLNLPVCLDVEHAAMGHVQAFWRDSASNEHERSKQDGVHSRIRGHFINNPLGQRFVKRGNRFPARGGACQNFWRKTPFGRQEIHNGFAGGEKSRFCFQNLALCDE
ncbi:MAG: hypothetical protein II967_06230, partial [Deltaproteobacteria bacterium]|nr:hypothetical protein [Deltaproteobacteria bacterium]